jgi:delta 1-pyrroline-5-carboxylate dehydrogenase
LAPVLVLLNNAVRGVWRRNKLLTLITYISEISSGEEREMASVSTQAHSDSYQVVSTVEGEIKELFRKESAARNSTADTSAHLEADSISSLLMDVAGQSLKEIDGLISELQEVRDFLQRESDRVRREVAKFAETSQGALACIKSINSAIAPWKGANASPTR